MTSTETQIVCGLTWVTFLGREGMFPDKAQEEEFRGAPRSEERGAGSGPSRTSAHRTRRVIIDGTFFPGAESPQ